MPRTFKGNAMAAGDATLKFSALTGCAGRTLVDLVARQTGFSDRDHMRRAILRAFGQPPQVLRRNSRREAIDWQSRQLTQGQEDCDCHNA
jgi:AraC-like DNA-binding protein